MPGKTYAKLRIDLLAVSGLALLAGLITQLTTKHLLGHALPSFIIFCCSIAAYLGWRKPKPWLKIGTGALIFGGIFGTFFELIQQYNRAYTLPYTLLPRLFHTVSSDAIVGHMVMSLVVLTFYEHFINQDNFKVVSRRARYIAFLGLSVVLLTITIFYTHPALLMSKYPYFYTGLLAILPVILVAWRKPKYIRDFTLITPYFFFLFLILEWLAVPRGWWIYPGNNYIGYISIFSLHFPVEELLFWMLCYAAALVSYYKLFIDRSD